MPSEPQLRLQQKPDNTRLLPVTLGCPYLHPLSKFSGRQCSQRSSYGVAVLFHHVDFEADRVCGELKIDELARNHQDVTTFFDAEVVKTSDDFFTRRWGADAAVDLAHWKHVAGFHPSYMLDEEAYDYRTNRFIFMRWKEKFVVPFWEPQDVPGASYAGFYYISFDRVKGTIMGYYFFRRSERYQLLELEYQDTGQYPQQGML